MRTQGLPSYNFHMKHTAVLIVLIMLYITSLVFIYLLHFVYSFIHSHTTWVSIHVPATN